MYFNNYYYCAYEKKLLCLKMYISRKQTYFPSATFIQFNEAKMLTIFVPCKLLFNEKYLIDFKTFTLYNVLYFFGRPVCKTKRRT